MGNLGRNAFHHNEDECKGALVAEFDTIDKVHKSLTDLGWSEFQATEAIDAIQNAGILFRERAK